MTLYVKYLKFDFRARLLKSVGTCVVVSGRGSPVRRARLLDAARLRPSALAALPRHNKLPAALHKHYTALEVCFAISQFGDGGRTFQADFLALYF